MTEKCLETKDLTKVYEVGDETVYALKKCSISIEKGEQIAIMGPSGSGKSTLLSLIGGVIKPTKGDILFGDTNLSQLNEDKLAKFRRQNIGFVFQDFRLIPEMTAKQNILLCVKRAVEAGKPLKPTIQEPHIRTQLQRVARNTLTQ